MGHRESKSLSQETWLVFTIIAVLLILCVEIWGSSLNDKIKTERRNMISLLPVGDIENTVLNLLKSRLEKEFACDVKIREGWALPQEAYNPERRQHLSSSILRRLRKTLSPRRGERILAICDVDLYVPQLNFVFGEAELEGHFAVISLARLRQSFYGLPENRVLFLERATKEAVHELGHTFGLRHCPDSRCVMHFSNSLLDTDRKEASFCTRCRKLLRERKAFQKE